MKVNLTVSIVITTKNRKDELAKCIDSCLPLRDVDEILIFDDGSTDDTYSFVRATYPGISIHRSDNSLGLINARTKCASLASGDIIVSIDDDCIFKGQTTISEIVRYFDNARIAAVTIPAIDVLKSDEITQKGIGNIQEVYICSQYRGCAHAVRRDVFLSLGGYYNNLVRQEEETEFAMRLYNLGYVIRVANCSEPILHYHSTQRNYYQIAFYRARNKFLICFLHSPLIIVFFELLKIVFSLSKYEIKHGQFRACMLGFKDAISVIINGVKREPMSLKSYMFFKRLRLNNSEKITLV